MTKEERSKKLESYADAPDGLRKALERIPREAWTYRPAPDRWTIHEIVMHIADSEANGYVRCRRLIAEPGTQIMAYDQDAWARALCYHDQDIGDALELILWLRRTTYQLLRMVPEEVWTNRVDHPEVGSITLDDWLETYERHIPIHIDQIHRNYQAWKDRPAAS